MALFDVGTVYVWGGNEHGEQGNKKRGLIDRPRLMRNMSKKVIQSIHCSTTSSAIITKE